MKKTGLNILSVMLLMLYSVIIVRPVYSVDYEPGSETSFTLIKPLIIPGGAASVFIQKNITTRNEALIDQYYANCRFEQHALAMDDYTIEPNNFIVTDSRLSSDPVTRCTNEFITLFYLTAEKSKKKYTLECQHWGDSSDRYLTREEIQTTVKEYFKIEP